MNLSQKYSFLSLRGWCLVGNFISNAMALYGLSVLTRGGDGWPWLVPGIVLTLVFVLVLAIPDLSDFDHKLPDSESQ